MKKVRWHFVFFWIVLFLFWYCAPTEGHQEDFNTKTVKKLCQIFKTAEPEIVVEVVSQETLQDMYRGEQMVQCMRETNNFPGCSNYVRNLRVFISGVWLHEESSATKVSIRLYEKAGVEVLVHEFLHWWLYYRTEPLGLINSEESVKTLTTYVSTSPAFISWLKEER